MFGKVGRPAEDRLLRQREIFEAVAPLILEVGARELTMRQAAHRASMSIGGMYHYFPSKRDLVLHSLEQDAHDRLCIDFMATYGHLQEIDPDAFLEAFIDFQVHAAAFIRPALHAAMDLGAETVWPTIDRAMSLGLEDWARIARRVVPDAEERDLVALCRAVRRTMFGAMLDKTVTPAELREELRALIVGEPVGLRSEWARTA